MKTFTRQGLNHLTDILASHYKSWDKAKANVDCWASEIEGSIDNRKRGESLTTELRGVRDVMGYTVHFTPVEGDLTN
jgi:hypothetical protein